MSLLAASGGYATGIYLVWKEWSLEDLIETIELVSELNNK